MSEAIWNTLHDGTIEAVSGQVPGDVHLRVGIEYLCGELSTAESSLNLCLRKCRRFEYRPFGEPPRQAHPLTELARIGEKDIEVLSALSRDDAIIVQCVSGELATAYESCEVRTGEGSIVPQNELEAVADRYWRKWEEGNKHMTKPSS